MLFNRIYFKSLSSFHSKKGMELVQVAILIALAVAVGLIFKDKLETFVKAVFTNLGDGSKFSG